MTATRHPSIARALGEVRAVLTRELSAGEGLLLACSGGADSMALLGLVARVAAEVSGPVAVGHVNHGLRADAEAEGRLVRAAAEALKLPFESISLDLAAGPGLPARARQARYDALRGMAERRGIAVVATGHTATDQLETMLMHLARGAGLVGLGGMPPRRGDLLRPLLGLTRSETRETAERLGHAFVDDPTNDDTAHPRVALRAAVLPVLRDLNPGVERAAHESAALMRSAAEVIAECAARLRVAQVSAGTLRARGWSAHRAVVRLQALRTFLTGEGVDDASLSLRVLRAVDAALLEWDAHLEADEGPGGEGPGGEGPGGEGGADPPADGSRGGRRPPGGARPRAFHVRPRRCLRVDRRGLWVEARVEKPHPTAP